MAIMLEHPPFRPNRHRRTISRQTMDTVLENSFCDATSTRPSTASTDSSFTTAFSTLEGSPFRYYLPHISTPTSPVYTRNGYFACNISLEQGGVQIDQVGRFYQYVPDESTETGDVYTDACTYSATSQQVPPEPKALGAWNDLFSTGPPISAEVNSLIEFVVPNESSRKPVIHITEEIDVDVCSYTAGEILSSRTSVRNAGSKKQRNKLNKNRHGKSRSEVNVSEKIKKMFRKLHLSKAGK